MKGPAPIPVPDNFTLEWYTQQKELRRTDIQIAQSLYVSSGTLHNWKQQIGWVSGKGLKYCGRKMEFNPKQMVELYEKGFSQYEIADELNCNRKTVQNYLKRFGGYENDKVPERKSV